MNLLLRACCTVFLPLLTSGQTSSPSESYIAKAGDVFISEQEFIHRFELLPAFGRQRKSQLEKAKLELLYSIIAEKLLAQEAVAHGLDQDPLIRMAVEETRKLLARDELYRKEISGKVSVTQREIREGVAQARRQLFVSYLFFERKEDALFVRSHMRGSADFDRFQIDSTMHGLRDTATVIWGEADPAIQVAAYRLHHGEISPVVVVGAGYYILKLSSEKKSPFFSSLQSDVIIERVQKKIRSRKERDRLDEYTEEVLKDKAGYALPRTLKTFSSCIDRISAQASKDTTVVVTPAMMNAVRSQCPGILQDSLAVVGSVVWTVNDVVDMLALKGIRVRRGDPLSALKELNVQLRLLVLQELIAQEALRRRVDTVAEVQRRLDVWKQYFLAEQMKGILKKGVTVTDADVWSYLQALDPQAPTPEVQIRELRTGSLEDMKEALDELERGVAFEQVIQRWSSDPNRKETGGISPYFRITDRHPIGEIASRMEIGQRYGPVPVNGGYLYFELLGKKSSAASSDTSLASRADAARHELLKRKQNRRISLFLAQTGRERGFMVYEDRLRAIDVTPTPMMTLRILGFGGRMFEVPFVEREIEWLGIEPPQSKILP